MFIVRRGSVVSRVCGYLVEESFEIRKKKKINKIGIGERKYKF